MNNPNRPEVVSFNDIKSPGCYVTAQGSLIRVASEAVTSPRLPLISVFSNDDTRVTKISDDSQLPIASAAKLAESWNLPVNFTPVNQAGSASSVNL